MGPRNDSCRERSSAPSHCRPDRHGWPRSSRPPAGCSKRKALTPSPCAGWLTSSEYRPRPSTSTSPERRVSNSALIEDGLVDIGQVSHRAIQQPGSESRLDALLTAYHRYSVSHPNLYRLATSGPLPREQLPSGLEEWAGNPWFVVTGDPSLAQALWSFAHGMVILELDDRYPPGSDLDQTWRTGAAAFSRSVNLG